MENAPSLKEAQVLQSCNHCEENLDVAWKCLTCDLLLCFRCGRKHTEDPEQDHMIINLKDTEQGPMCKIHKDFDICSFCQFCEEPICSRCLVQMHQGHSFQEIEKVYKEKIQNLDKCHTKISSEFILFFSSERNKLEKLSELQKENYENEKQKIIEHDKKVKDKIALYSNELLQELENQWNDTHSRIEKLRSDMEQTIFGLEMKLSLIKENQQSIDIENICNITKEVNNMIQNMNLSPIPLPWEANQFLQGEVNQENIEMLTGSLQKFNLLKIINFHVLKSYNTDLSIIGSISTNKLDGTVWMRGYKESLLRRLKLAGDKQPIGLEDITNIKVNNIATTNSGDLLMTVVGNPCIKKVEDSGEITDFYKFPKNIFGSCQLPLGLHASVDGTIIISSVEKGGKKYSVSKSSHRQVEVLSQDGKRLNLFEFDQIGERLFTWPCRLNSNSSGDVCVVDWTDSDNGRIVCLDSTGVLKWIYAGNPYNARKLFHPYDMVTTSDGNVYMVCSAKENAIHVLNHEGEIIKYQQSIDLGIYRPFSMDIDREGRLLVGNYQGQIFTLQFTGC